MYLRASNISLKVLIATSRVSFVCPGLFHIKHDVSGIITGGTFIGTGARNMAQTFSESKQGVIAVSVGNQEAGTLITLTDGGGNVIISHKPEQPFAVVILSSPEIKKGETYKIMVGEASGEFEAE